MKNVLCRKLLLFKKYIILKLLIFNNNLFFLFKIDIIINIYNEFINS